MKKTLCSLVAAGVMSMTPAMAQEVGEAMPDYKTGTSIIGSGYGYTTKGDMWKVEGYKDGDKEYAAAKLYCKEGLSELPFGIYDIKNKILYIDNNPTDGIIDKKYVGTPGMPNVGETAPACPE